MPSRVIKRSRLVSLSSTIRMRGGLCMLTCSRQELTHFCEQRTGAKGLGDVGVAARCPRLALVARQSVRGNSDYRNFLHSWIGFDAPGRLVAVHDGQLNIHQDQVWPLRLDGHQSFFAAFGFDQLISGVTQHIAKNAPVVRLIFNHQDALAHDSLACRSTFTGIVNANVEPLPTSASTQIRPPCIPMMRLAIESPRPVPPFRLVAELSACWNSSKIFP